MGIDRVAAEAPAQLVVDAALGHLLQRRGRHVQRLQVRRLAQRGAAPVPEQALQAGRMGKLRRGAEAAMLGVEVLAELAPRDVQRLPVEFHFPRRRAGGRLPDGREGLAHALGMPADLFLVIAPVAVDPLEQFRETRQPVARGRREVGAAEERRLVLGRQEHGQRPAAVPLGDHLVSQLVDAIEIRALLAVHLDVDEQVVHPRGDRRVLEALVGHDVAPVARGVTDGQQDGLALAARALERLRVPGVPVHRIVGVLQQVGAGLVGEAVAVSRHRYYRRRNQLDCAHYTGPSAALPRVMLH